MTNFFVILSLALVTYQPAIGAPVSQINLDHKSKSRSICGFNFSAVKGLIVVAKPMSEESLKTRVDNKRFDACPFNVTLSYRSIAMHLDFSEDVTLERVRSVADDGAVRTAFFRFDENGWGAAGDDISFEKTDIKARDSEHTYTLAGVVMRKIVRTTKSDYCFVIDVIGEEKYVTGAVCRPTRNELLPMKTLFEQNLIISSDEQG